MKIIFILGLLIISSPVRADLSLEDTLTEVIGQQTFNWSNIDGGGVATETAFAVKGAKGTYAIDCQEGGWRFTFLKNKISRLSFTAEGATHPITLAQNGGLSQAECIAESAQLGLASTEHPIKLSVSGGQYSLSF